MNAILQPFLMVQLLVAGNVTQGPVLATPLHPDFAEELKASGELESVLTEWKEFNEKHTVTALLAQPEPYNWTSGAGIAILVDFEDNPADSLKHSPAAYDTLLFSEGVLKSGSMKDFYIENSYGKFAYSGKTAPPQENGRTWYRLEGSYDDYWSRNRGFRYSGEMAQSAVAAADPDIDFGLYDNDGSDGIPNSGDDDGFIDAVYVIHAGPGYEEGCGKIWSHMSVTEYETNDNSANGGKIMLRRYSMQPEEKCDGSIIHMGVFAHEYGHILGMPDLYDYDYNSHGTGKWSLMSGGSWNGNGRSPAHFDAWCKYKLGWIEPIEVSDFEIAAQIPAVEYSPVVYKLWTDGDKTSQEYFLVENRQQMGLFDSRIPGSGLLIYHVDELQDNNDLEYIPGVHNPLHHFRVALEQADGKFGLEYYQSPGDQGDPFPGSSNRREFAGFQPYPTSRDYFEEDTKVGVLAISSSDSVMYANLDVGRNLPYFSLLDVRQSAESGRIRPGEEGAIEVTLANTWGPGSSVYAELEIEHPSVTVTDYSSMLGDVEEQDTIDNSSDPFGVYLEADAPENLELIATLTIRKTGLGILQELEFSISFGWPGLLIVNDASDENLTEIYTSTLENIGITYETLTSDDLSEIEGLLLSSGVRDSVLVWFTGQESSTLNPQEQNLISSFLSSGGKLIISSQNLGEDIGSSQFYSDVLDAEFKTPSEPDIIFSGAADNPITSTDEQVAVTGAYGTSKDGIAPRGSASTIFTYSSENSAAIVSEDGSAQVVYLGFPFEGIGGDPNILLSKEKLMGRFLSWFGYDLGITEEDIETESTAIKLITPLVSKNESASVLLSLSRPDRVHLELFDVTGRSVSSHDLGFLQSGVHTLQFKTNNLPSGVYFLNLFCVPLFCS